MQMTLASSTRQIDTDSIHRRHVPSPIIEHRHSSVTSFVQHDAVVLKRHLGLFSGTCFIVGIIIGSGIFISPKGVLRETQSVGLCLVVWAISGVISLLGALCYAEIGAVIPRNGAEIAYMKEGIGSVHERTGDILAYLCAWTFALIVKPLAISIISLTFSRYFLSGIMSNCEPPDELVKLLAIFVIVLMINVNSLSVSVANRVNIIFVICKVFTILVIIIAGLVRIGQGYTQNLTNSFAGTTSKPLGVALAFYKGLFAYGGWYNLNCITEELKNPKRNLWLSIVLALPSIIVLYVLTNISYFTVMNKATLLSSNAVAVTWGEAVLGPVARVLPILISISALGTANATLFAGARYSMVASQYGYLPAVFSCIHTQRLTPIPGVILQGFITIIFCIPSGIDSLIDLFSFSSWFFFGLTFLATLCCKFTKKDADRVINVPIPIIILMILVALYLIVAPVISSPKIEFLLPVLLISSGLVFYYPFVYRKIQLNIMTRINNFLISFFQLQKAEVKI